MAFLPPTLIELREQIVTSIESKTGDNVPIYEKAFYSLLSNGLVLISYPIYKFISWNYNQAFVVSSDEEHLEGFHGLDEGVNRGFATKTEFDVELTVTQPTVISISTTFENEATGLFYFPKQEKSVTVSDDTITLIADGYGEAYAVDIDDELKMTVESDGVSSLCIVSNISIHGMDKQDLEDYRNDVLQSRSGVTGGSSPSDYRKWGQAVSGVDRIFPFSGRPDNPSLSLPGDRSVFVEADQALGTDGIASVSLVNNVKAAIITNPDTGQERECLGLTESTLYVQSVELVSFTVIINDLVVKVEQETELKNSILISVSDYLKSLSPFVPSIDPEYERNDNVSSITVSENVGKILRQYSAYASSIEIHENGVGAVDNRLLIGGDLARLYEISYVN